MTNDVEEKLIASVRALDPLIDAEIGMTSVKFYKSNGGWLTLTRDLIALQGEQLAAMVVHEIRRARPAAIENLDSAYLELRPDLQHVSPLHELHFRIMAGDSQGRTLANSTIESFRASDPKSRYGSANPLAVEVWLNQVLGFYGLAP